MNEAEMDQSNQLVNLLIYLNQKQKKKRDTYESAFALYETREITLNAFRSGIFAIKARKAEGLKILKDYH